MLGDTVGVAEAGFPRIAGVDVGDVTVVLESTGHLHVGSEVPQPVEHVVHNDERCIGLQSIEERVETLLLRLRDLAVIVLVGAPQHEVVISRADSRFLFPEVFLDPRGLAYPGQASDDDNGSHV